MTAENLPTAGKSSTDLFGLSRFLTGQPSRLARDRPYGGGGFRLRVLQWGASIALFGFLAACSTTDDRLIATVTEDGQRAYSAQGIIQFTASEEAAEAYIAERVEAAWGARWR